MEVEHQVKDQVLGDAAQQRHKVSAVAIAYMYLKDQLQVVVDLPVVRLWLAKVAQNYDRDGKRFCRNFDKPMKQMATLIISA